MITPYLEYSLIAGMVNREFDRIPPELLNDLLRQARLSDQRGVTTEVPPYLNDPLYAGMNVSLSYLGAGVPANVYLYERTEPGQPRFIGNDAHINARIARYLIASGSNLGWIVSLAMAGGTLHSDDARRLIRDMGNSTTPSFSIYHG